MLVSPPDLIKNAERALKFARPIYSGFRVGVAVLCASGNIYTGANFENLSLMNSLCAEKLAILKALSEEENAEIKAIAIVSERIEYCLPCGSCRQFIFEFAPQADIYVSGKRGIKKYSIEELLPEAFNV